MAIEQFEALLAEADNYVRQGEWQKTFDTLTAALAHQPDHAGTYSGLGTCLIQMGQLEEALEYFQKTVSLAPESAEAHNNYGVALSLAGHLQEAEAAYQEAIAQDSDHVPAWKNLAQLYLQQDDRMAEGVQILAAVVQSHPEEVDALLVLASCYEFGEDPDSALELYQRVAEVEPENLHAKEAIARLQPSAGGQDIRRIAQAAHIGKLAGLKKRRGAAETKSPPPPPNGGATGNRSVSFYGLKGIPTQTRLGIPAKALVRKGIQVKLGTEFHADDLAMYDTIILAQPQQDTAVYNALEQGNFSGKKIILDLADDYHHLPADHPDYQQLGRGNANGHKALDALLAAAECVTVPSAALKTHYEQYASRVEVIPNTWSRENFLWEKDAPPREQLHVGLLTTVTQRKDAALLKQTLSRLVREFPGLTLVIAGDPSLFSVFSNVPEENQMFIPLTTWEDYPFTLAYMDVLLAPMRDIPYNRNKSDAILMEAGIRRIPWVASPIPAFKDWGAGGLIADKLGDWYLHVKSLVEDAAYREALGEAGRAAAEAREVGAVIQKWLEVV